MTAGTFDMLVAYLHFAANPSAGAPAPIEAWSLRAGKVLAKISRLLMHSKVPAVTSVNGVFQLPVAASAGEASASSAS